jgi:hypothetical protein
VVGVLGDDYFHLLQELKMDGMVRTLASPFQFRVTNKENFLLNVQMLDHKEGSVWMSQNRTVKGQLLMEKVFTEMEGKGPAMKDQEQAHSDMLKLIEWDEKVGEQAIVIHSGNKSFYVFELIKDQIANANSEVRQYNSIGKGHSDTLGLKSVDFRCCEPKRLHRVPLTHRETNPIQHTCTPIPINMLSDLKAILDLVQHPVVKYGSYRTKGRQMTIDELVKLSGIGGSSSTSLPMENFSNQSLSISKDTNDLVKYLDNILPQKCVLNEILSLNPIHDARVAYVCWLNYLQYSVQEALDLTDRVAEYANWEDKDNFNARKYYVKHSMGRGYVPYSCGRLQFKGMKCVGKNCPMWGGDCNTK